MRKLDRYTIILASVIVVATLLFASVLTLFSSGNKRRITLQNSEYLSDATRRMAANIDAEIQAGYDNIRIVANLLNDSRTSSDVDVSKLRELMENSVFDFIEFADREGWDHTVKNTKTYAGDRMYYTEGVLKGKTGMELIYNSRATHETLLMFYSPVSFNGEIIGAVIGVYQAANKITRLLTADYFGKRALAYLATPEGRIVASSEGYDPTAENYLESLPEGGCLTELETSRWHLMQYFPEEATANMVANANKLGFLLSGSFLLLYVLVLLSVIIYIRHRHRIHQAELETALSAAESASRAKTTFLNNMTHDIRTPMNAIVGFNNIALNELGRDENKVRDSLEKLRHSTDGLLSIINDILELSRIEAGKVSIENSRCDVMYSFVSIEAMMTELAQKAGLELQFSFGTVTDRYVLCDVPHATRVFTNLISNAIKYTERGGWVHVRCEQVGRTDERHGLYRYTFEDNGIGISDEFQNNLFEQFARERTSTVSKIQGTGLGLAMCKDLVELMHGTITCQSTKGHGTTFIVELPFELQEGDVHADRETSDVSDFNIHGCRILLVDDNELNREIATAILEGYGCIITPAEDGDIAVEMMRNAQAGDYDLVLMDIQMPTIDGYEATRQIRALDTPISCIPIIAMTANAFEEDRRAALDAGMNEHIAKPIDIPQLKSIIARFAR